MSNYRFVLPFPDKPLPNATPDESGAREERMRIMGLLSVIEQRGGGMPVVETIMQSIGAKLHRTPAFEALGREIEKLPPDPRDATEAQMDAVATAAMAASKSISETAAAIRAAAKRDAPCDCPMCVNDRAIADAGKAARSTVTH